MTFRYGLSNAKLSDSNFILSVSFTPSYAAQRSNNNFKIEALKIYLIAKIKSTKLIFAIIYFFYHRNDDI